jgi:hypothetical protein
MVAGRSLEFEMIESVIGTQAFPCLPVTSLGICNFRLAWGVWARTEQIAA